MQHPRCIEQPVAHWPLQSHAVRLVIVESRASLAIHGVHYGVHYGVCMEQAMPGWIAERLHPSSWQAKATSAFGSHLTNDRRRDGLARPCGWTCLRLNSYLQSDGSGPYCSVADRSVLIAPPMIDDVTGVARPRSGCLRECVSPNSAAPRGGHVSDWRQHGDGVAEERGHLHGAPPACRLHTAGRPQHAERWPRPGGLSGTLVLPSLSDPAAVCFCRPRPGGCLPGGFVLAVGCLCFSRSWQGSWRYCMTGSSARLRVHWIQSRGGGRPSLLRPPHTNVLLDRTRRSKPACRCVLARKRMPRCHRPTCSHGLLLHGTVCDTEVRRCTPGIINIS